MRKRENADERATRKALEHDQMNDLRADLIGPGLTFRRARPRTNQSTINPKRGIMKKFFLIVIVGLVAIFAISGLVGASTSSSKSVVLDPQQNSVTADPASGTAPTARKVHAYGDGTWEVGTDIKAGTYKTKGGSLCYWQRDSNTDGDIIDNNFGDGPQVVHIKATDAEFETRGCGKWVKQ